MTSPTHSLFLSNFYNMHYKVDKVYLLFNKCSTIKKNMYIYGSMCKFPVHDL